MDEGRGSAEASSSLPPLEHRARRDWRRRTKEEDTEGVTIESPPSEMRELRRSDKLEEASGKEDKISEET